MANLMLVVILMLSSLLVSIPNSSANKQGSKDLDLQWFQKLCNKKEDVTKLHFFVQNMLAGPNRTVYQVANSSITSSTSPTSFGLVVAVDDLLTVGPEKDSGDYGRFQGLIASSDLNKVAITMNINIFITSGQYNGSTLSIAGRNQVLDPPQELPVVGGTGVFRMARGFAFVSTYSRTSDHDVLEYTIYVAYLSSS